MMAYCGKSEEGDASMQQRWLITGAGGFVAGSILAQAPEDIEIFALSRGPGLLERPNLRWLRFDPLDFDRLEREISVIRPETILHTAALADIDYCEAHPEEAVGVNTTLTTVLAGMAARLGIRMVHCSTDTVFDGARGRYIEEDAPAPVNLYGQSKAEAENVVARLEKEWVIARIALVMGLPMLGAGNSFLSRMIPALERGEELGVPPEEIRSPIDVVTLGRALIELAGNDFTGYLHLAGNDILNRVEMVKRIALRLGHDPALVVPKDPSGLPGRATRPRDVSLMNTKARSVLTTRMCGLEEGLERVLAAQ
jgi:dTDP-4-dehydrorhamnose reductase